MGKLLDQNTIINRFKNKYKDKYDYSKFVYIKSTVKGCIICPEHGEFWQTPDKHLQKHNCPKCNISYNEYIISEILNSYNIQYFREWSPSWLYKQRLDFYLPNYNVAIEYNGQQHYFPVDFAGKGTKWANDHFILTVNRDNRKLKLCQENGILVYTIPYIEDVYIIMNYIINELTN